MKIRISSGVGELWRHRTRAREVQRCAQVAASWEESGLAWPSARNRILGVRAGPPLWVF